MEVTDGVSVDDLVAGTQLLWKNRCSLTEPVPWGDLVLLADRLRGDGAEIWMSSLVVVQHITLINHLNASFSGPLAWTAAQNKEIESHLNQECTAELTWNESYRVHGRWIPIRQRERSRREAPRGNLFRFSLKEKTKTQQLKASKFILRLLNFFTAEFSSFEILSLSFYNFTSFHHVSYCRFSFHQISCFQTLTVTCSSLWDVLSQRDGLIKSNLGADVQMMSHIWRPETTWPHYRL